MDDLGARLDRRSERSVLPSDALERTLARGARRQRNRRLASGGLALAILVAGSVLFARALSGRDTVPAVPPSPTGTTPTGTIPEGTYWTRPLSRADILESLQMAGFTRGEAKRKYLQRALPFDGWIRQGLALRQGAWIQMAETDPGFRETGWIGSYEVTGPDTILTEETGRGCRITYRFAIDGLALTLDVLDDACGGRDLIAQTAIFETAPFVRDPTP